MSTWHYSRNGQTAGPVSAEQLKQLAATGQLQPADLIWKDGMTDWVPASKIKGLFAAVTPASPAAASAAPQPVASTVPAAAAVQQPVGASAIPYYSAVSGVPDRAVQILKGYATSTGERGEWPLNDQHLLQLKEAEKQRRKIRNASGLYKGLFALSIIILVVLLISLLFAFASSRNSAGVVASLIGMGAGVGVFGAFTALYYFAYRATKKCQKWAPLTLFILFILSIIVEFGGAIVQSTSSRGAENLIGPILGMILPAAFAVTSWQAFAAIPKFLATPMWCQEALVNSDL